MTQVPPPILSITPSRALVDEKFKVLVENLPPGCPVTVRSLHRSEDEDDWEAYGHYVSDHRGIVSVSEDLIFGGTYTGKEPMGLLWSMQPVPGSRPGLRPGHSWRSVLVPATAMTQVPPPILSITPSRALVDEKFKVLVENLPPGCPVTVRSLHRSEDEDDWEAYGHYVSDHRGIVSVSEDLSFGGTYTGKEPMGLLWSMRPVPGSRPGLRLRKLNVCTPMVVNISVHSGHEGFRDRAPLASAVTERWYMAPGVQRITINEQGVRGTLFIPAGPGPFPGLLDMWGGGGGLMEYRAALLASHGYVSLALDYLWLDRGSENFLLYFEAAFNIIKDHPQVMPDRVGILGLSLGSLVALCLAAYSTVIQPRCIICISSNHYFPPGSTFQSGSEGIIGQYSKVNLEKNKHVRWTDVIVELIADPSNTAEAGRINCPMLLVNGCDDQSWPSVETAEDIARMMREGGKEHLLSSLVYPDTGHLIEPPFSPHFRATNFMYNRRKKVILWGGQTKPHSDAQEDSWNKILSFLHLHLYRGPSLKAKL